MDSEATHEKSVRLAFLVLHSVDNLARIMAKKRDL
jgi:hypothetical protein